jgi:hypothetical protein
VLDAAQALCIALPAAGVPAALLRLGGRGWALVAPVSVLGSVAAITVASASADVLTWIAILLVPPGCALALGWAERGARPWLAVLAPDYGDFLIAGLIGGILALERRPQVAAAALTFAVAQLWNQLFLVVDSLPGTVPPALVLVGVELWSRQWGPRPMSS